MIAHFLSHDQALAAIIKTAVIISQSRISHTHPCPCLSFSFPVTQFFQKEYGFFLAG